MLFSKHSDKVTNKLKKDTWKKISRKICACGVECSVAQVKHRWSDMASHTKNARLAQVKEQRRTGGGPAPLDLSQQEERVLDVMGKTAYEGVEGGLDSEECRIITESEDTTIETESTQGSIWETESTQESICEAPSAIIKPHLSNIEEEESIGESQRNVIPMTGPSESSRKRPRLGKHPLSKEQTHNVTKSSYNSVLEVEERRLKIEQEKVAIEKEKLATLKCISSSLEQLLNQATPSNRNFPWGSADDIQNERPVTLGRAFQQQTMTSHLPSSFQQQTMTSQLSSTSTEPSQEDIYTYRPS